MSALFLRMLSVICLEGFDDVFANCFGFCKLYAFRFNDRGRGFFDKRSVFQLAAENLNVFFRLCKLFFKSCFFFGGI